MTPLDITYEEDEAFRQTIDSGTGFIVTTSLYQCQELGTLRLLDAIISAEGLPCGARLADFHEDLVAGMIEKSPWDQVIVVTHTIAQEEA